MTSWINECDMLVCDETERTNKPPALTLMAFGLDGVMISPETITPVRLPVWPNPTGFMSIKMKAPHHDT